MERCEGIRRSFGGRDGLGNWRAGCVERCVRSLVLRMRRSSSVTKNRIVSCELRGGCGEKELTA